MPQQFDGTLRWRREYGYEAARTTGQWTGPGRFCHVIVGAASDESSSAFKKLDMPRVRASLLKATR